MKIIIVPIDFSTDSINALEHAIIIANRIEAQIRLMHVVKSKNFEPPFIINDFSSTSANTIDDFMKIILDKYKDKAKHGMDYKVREGKIFKEICNQAKYDDAYLIIMGTHGASGFEEMVIGSNAYRVVVHAPCPIITISQKYAPIEPQRIVLPIDLSKDTRKKVPFVTEFALLFHAQIDVIGVSELETDDVREKLNTYTLQVESFLKEKNITTTRELLLGNDISESTINYAKEHNAQLIAIMTEQLNRLAFWLGPHAQEIVNHSPIPVISFSPNVF